MKEIIIIKKQLSKLRSKIYWKLLNKSKILHFAMCDFLTNLCFELERFDLDGEDTKKKYYNKLKKYEKLAKGVE